MDSNSPSPFLPQSPQIPKESAPASPPTLPPKHSTGTRIVAVVLILALLGGGYYALAYALGWWPLAPAPVESPSPTPTADPMAGWSKYANEKYGFTISLPPNFVVEPYVARPADYVEFLSPAMQALRLHNQENCGKIGSGLPLPSGEYCSLELSFMDFRLGTMSSDSSDNFTQVIGEEVLNGTRFELWRVGGGIVSEYAYLPPQPSDGDLFGFFVYDDGPASASENLEELRKVLATFERMVLID